jgi:hypothetical protein
MFWRKNILLIKALIFIGIIGFSLHYFNKLVRCWLGLKKRSREEKYVNTFHKYGTHFISLVLSYFLIFIYKNASLQDLFWVFVTFIIVIFVFDTLMEWIHYKDKKEFMASFINGVFGLLMLKSCTYYAPFIFG